MCTRMPAIGIDQAPKRVNQGPFQSWQPTGVLGFNLIERKLTGCREREDRSSQNFLKKPEGSDGASQSFPERAIMAPGWEIRRQPVCHSACNIDPLSRGIGVQN